MDETFSGKKNFFPPKNEVKEEDYSWIQEDDDNLKEKFIKFPIDRWNVIISNYKSSLIDDTQNPYQVIVNKILKEDIFKNLNFKEENNIYNLLYNFEEYDGKNFDIKPDFVISQIPKNIFLNIMKENNYMFRYDINYNKLDQYDYINILGEVKVNPDQINKKGQKNNYLEFCEYMNKKSIKKYYYFVMYIYDVSFKNFWKKNFFQNKLIIMGYIPKIYKRRCWELQQLLKNNRIEKDQNIIINNINIPSEIKISESIYEGKIKEFLENYLQEKEIKKIYEESALKLKEDIENEIKINNQKINAKKEELKAEKRKQLEKRKNELSFIYNIENMLSKKRKRLEKLKPELNQRNKIETNWKKKLIEKNNNLESEKNDIKNKKLILQKREIELQKAYQKYYCNEKQFQEYAIASFAKNKEFTELKNTIEFLEKEEEIIKNKIKKEINDDYKRNENIKLITKSLENLQENNELQKKRMMALKYVSMVANNNKINFKKKENNGTNQ